MTTKTNLWSYRTDLSTVANAQNIVGYDVHATDGDIVMNDAASTETSRQYLVVDTGFWIFGKKRMVPAGLVSGIDHNDKRVVISMTKDQIKAAPDYDDVDRRYTDDDYDTFGSYYRGLP